MSRAHPLLGVDAAVVPRTGCSIRCGRTCRSVTPPSSGRQTRAWAAGPGGGAKRPRARTGRTGRLRLLVKDLEDPRRAEPPKDGLGEREMLEAWLEFHRTTLLLKCEGADDHARKARPVATSRLSLHGLVRRMAEVGAPGSGGPAAGARRALPLVRPRHRRQRDGPPGRRRAEAGLAAWQAECQASRKAAAARSLSGTGLTRIGEPCSLQWIYVHMIEEYARHNGHADLIRELTDRAVGWQAQQQPAGACPSATSPAGHGPGKRRPRVPRTRLPGQRSCRRTAWRCRASASSRGARPRAATSTATPR